MVTPIKPKPTFTAVLYSMLAPNGIKRVGRFPFFCLGDQVAVPMPSRSPFSTSMYWKVLDHNLTCNNHNLVPEMQIFNKLNREGYMNEFPKH